MTETDINATAESLTAADSGGAAQNQEGVLLKASDAASPGSPEQAGKDAQAQIQAERQRHWDDFQRHTASERLRESQDWHKQCAADKDLGGDRLNVSVARAQLALDRFDPDRQVGQWLQQSGFGNHPEVLRLFNRIADALGNDTVVNGQVVPGRPSLEDRLYPNWKV